MPRVPNNPLGEDSYSDEEFQSPDTDMDQTSYGLMTNYTKHIDDAPTTSRNAQRNSSARVQPTARKRTGGGSRSPSLTSTAPTHRRKKRKPIHRLQCLKEIIFLQGTTHTLIPLLPFGRVVREILMKYGHGEILRITRTALEALHESTELYITQQLQDAYTLTLHRGRVTLMVKDMELLSFLRGNMHKNID